MFVVYDKVLNINWEFKWEYRREIGKSPDSWKTRAYVRFLDRNTRERGILGSCMYLDKDHVSKDEMRLNLLYQALEAILCNSSRTEIGRVLTFQAVIERYAAVHSVPKQQTRLGPFQLQLHQDLQLFHNL